MNDATCCHIGIDNWAASLQSTISIYPRAGKWGLYQLSQRSISFGLLVVPYGAIKWIHRYLSPKYQWYHILNFIHTFGLCLKRDSSICTTTPVPPRTIIGACSNFVVQISLSHWHIFTAERIILWKAIIGMALWAIKTFSIKMEEDVETSKLNKHNCMGCHFFPVQHVVGCG